MKLVERGETVDSAGSMASWGEIEPDGMGAMGDW
jgi:hypothetical protein